MEAVENIIEKPVVRVGKLLKILGVDFGIAVAIINVVIAATGCRMFALGREGLFI